MRWRWWRRERRGGGGGGGKKEYTENRVRAVGTHKQRRTSIRESGKKSLFADYRGGRTLNRGPRTGARKFIATNLFRVYGRRATNTLYTLCAIILCVSLLHYYQWRTCILFYAT